MTEGGVTVNLFKFREDGIFFLFCFMKIVGVEGGGCRLEALSQQIQVADKGVEGAVRPKVEVVRWFCRVRFRWLLGVQRFRLPVKRSEME